MSAVRYKPLNVTAMVYAYGGFLHNQGLLSPAQQRESIENFIAVMDLPPAKWGTYTEEEAQALDQKGIENLAKIKRTEPPKGRLTIRPVADLEERQARRRRARRKGKHRRR